MATPKTVIRLYDDCENGRPFEDREEEYDLDDFGGVTPAVGDRIVSPWVMKGLDRRDPNNREVFEVVRRYFQPMDASGTDRIYIFLVVRSQRATSDESDIAVRF